MAAEGERQRGTVLSLAQVSSLTGRSNQWVLQLAKAGFLPKEGHGKYPLVGLIRGIIAYYEDLQSKSSKAAAASRATDARTREIELRIKERSRELIPLEDARAELADWSAAVRAEFQGIHRRGPWRSFEAVKYATMECVDWFNNCRLLEPIENIPPREAEVNFYAALET